MPNDLKRDELQAATAAGQPAPDRVATIAAARHVYSKLDDSETAEAFRRNRIRGQIDGKPPWNPALLEEKGLGYVTNVNFLELRAALDDRAFRRFSSYHEVPTLIRVRQNFKYDQARPELPYASVIEEEFTRLLREDWEGAADAFMMWTKAGGQVLRGLVRRREAEKALFLLDDEAHST